jgi:hypothetical protein
MDMFSIFMLVGSSMAMVAVTPAQTALGLSREPKQAGELLVSDRCLSALSLECELTLVEIFFYTGSSYSKRE